MGAGATVMWDEALLGYTLAPDHPMHPVRLELTVALARSLGVLDAPGVTVVRPEPADDGVVELVHDRAYLDAVRRAPEDPFGRYGIGYGIGTPDNPVFWGMHEASVLIVGSTVDAARSVWQGAAPHAVSLAGGLHHAMARHASGFCVYNDVAVAITWLLGAGARRIAYVDIDVHHGDGVQAAFYDDPRVLTISVHQDGRTLFPGTGFPDEIGKGAAEGTSVNLALPPGTADDGWLRGVHAVVPALVRQFAPDVLVTQCGCDTHRLDPLADLRLTVDAHRAAYAMLHNLAHEVAGGRWLATGGGGYALVEAVPRSWTLLIAEAAGVQVAPDTPVPEQWRDLARRRRPDGRPQPTMSDGGSGRFEPWGGSDRDDPVDRAISATRSAVFPLHGLDPYDPRDV